MPTLPTLSVCEKLIMLIFIVIDSALSYLQFISIRSCRKHAKLHLLSENLIKVF